MYDALIPVGCEAVEDCEYGAKARKVVSCEVGDGCSAVRGVVLGVVPTSARSALTHGRVVYDVYSGKVYAPCLMYEGLELGVVEVLQIEATDGSEAVVHVLGDVAM